MRDKYGRPDLPFQVGIPGHLDLSVDTFGFESGFDPRYLEPSLGLVAVWLPALYCCAAVGVGTLGKRLVDG